MKRFNIAIILLSALCLFATSCTKGGVDDLTGVYDMPRYNFTIGSVGATEVQDDLIILNVNVSDGTNTLSIKFGSTSYTLRTTTYTLASSTITESGTYTATLNSSAVTYGDLDVTQIGDRYYLTAYMTAGGTNFIAKYIGGLTFIDPTGGDDSED